MSLPSAAAGVAAARGLGMLAALGFTVYVAGRFGSDRSTDIAFNALIIPNALSVVLATLLPSVFVSVFKSIEHTQGGDEAWDFARSTPRLVGIVSAAVAAAGALLSPAIAPVVGIGFAAEEVARLTGYMQVAFALLLLTSLASALKGILNANGVFFFPSLDTLSMNLAAVLTIVLTAGRWGAFSLVAGAVAGGAAKVLLMLPSYFRRRRPGPGRLFHPAFRGAVSMLVPVLLNSGVFAVNVAIVRGLASRIPIEGAVSHLNYAERIYSAPQDLFVMSMGAVILPALAAHAAAGRLVEVRSMVTRALRMAALFGIPGAVGLVLVAEPVTALLYQRGLFDSADTFHTARAVQGYAAALAFSGHLIVYQAFYALGRTRDILVSGVVMMAVNAGAGALLVGSLRQLGLGLAFSASYLAGYAVCLALFARAVGALDGRALVSGAVRVSICSAAMGAVVWSLRAFPVGVVIPAGVLVFLVLARFVCPEEWKHARTLWSRDDPL